MRRLKGLREPIKNLEGKDMQEATGLFIDPITLKVVPEGTQGALSQTREILPGRTIGFDLHQSDGLVEGRPSGFDPFLVDKLAKLLYESPGTLDLEDAEYGVIVSLFKSVVRPYWLKVPCQLILDDAEEIKKKKKED